MKRCKYLIILFLLIIVTGCSDSSKYEVLLEGSSNSYYNWSYEIEDDSIIKIVDESYYGKEADDEIVGLEGEYKFVFEALKAGETTIKFKYMRTWEQEDVLYEYVISLNVNDKLKISKKNESGNYLSLEKILTYDLDKLGLDKNFSEYKLIFDNNIVSIEGKECDFLTVYDYQDMIINVYGIARNENIVYKMVDGKMQIIE
ncbi:MAG: protease inhibitor I42 family protein [Bacilli bacterium]|nr:protease inhibitor I42 family protein [Bacilli bacterium]